MIVDVYVYDLPQYLPDCGPAAAAAYRPLIGPTLPGDSRLVPFPSMWEQSPDLDQHRHLWEFVFLESGEMRAEPETVVRCRFCHCPRCGHSNDLWPCQRRRHHSGAHSW